MTLNNVKFKYLYFAMLLIISLRNTNLKRKQNLFLHIEIRHDTIVACCGELFLIMVTK